MSLNYLESPDARLEEGHEVIVPLNLNEAKAR